MSKVPTSVRSLHGGAHIPHATHPVTHPIGGHVGAVDLPAEAKAINDPRYAKQNPKTVKRADTTPHAGAVEAGVTTLASSSGTALLFGGMLATLGASAVNFIVTGPIRLFGNHQLADKISGSLLSFGAAWDHTAMRDIAHIRGNRAMARDMVRIQGKQALKKNTEHLATLMDHQGDKQWGWVATAKEKLTPSFQRLGGWLNQLDDTKFGQTIAKPITNFSDWYAGKLSTKAAKITDVKTSAEIIGRADKWRALSNFKGIGGMLNKLPSAIARSPVSAVAMVGGGALVTLGSILSLRRETIVENHTLRNLAADMYGIAPEQVTKDMLLGKGAHPMITPIAMEAKAAGNRRKAFTAVDVAGNALTIGSFSGVLSGSMQMADMALNMGAMGILPSPSASLEAYQVLRSADAGKLQLAPEQRMQATAQLLSAVPAIAKNGGMHNELIGPVAYAMVTSGMDTAQMVKTMATPELFVPFSEKAKQQLQAERAAMQAQQQPAAAPAPAATSATATADVMHQAAAPAAKVSEISHQGMATGQNIAQAKAPASAVEQGHVARVQADAAAQAQQGSHIG